MGADMKHIKNRIKSVGNTLHITRAMKLVASSKIARAEAARKTAASFAEAVCEVLFRAVTPDVSGSPYVTPVNPDAPAYYVVIEADRGLAGGFNGNINRLVEASVPEGSYVSAVGKRACDMISRKEGLFRADVTCPNSEKPDRETISGIAEKIAGMMKSGEISGAFVVYTRLDNIITQTPVSAKLLPLEPPEKKGGVTEFEPGVTQVLERAVPMYLTGRLNSAISESFAAEQYARRNAMDSASDNASEMIDQLELTYNRARQNAITQEITEIVAGANAGE
ncbi:MAG: ATP synthase F1 subunit gamma [Clostridia bacterium]|nr:ATP synthase F1 subunit gamma [Clostridia bacterium]